MITVKQKPSPGHGGYSLKYPHKGKEAWERGLVLQRLWLKKKKKSFHVVSWDGSLRGHGETDVSTVEPHSLGLYLLFYWDKEMIILCSFQLLPPSIIHYSQWALASTVNNVFPVCVIVLERAVEEHGSTIFITPAVLKAWFSKNKSHWWYFIVYAWTAGRLNDSLYYLQ